MTARSVPCPVQHGPHGFAGAPSCCDDQPAPAWHCWLQTSWRCKAQACILSNNAFEYSWGCVEGMQQPAPAEPVQSNILRQAAMGLHSAAGPQRHVSRQHGSLLHGQLTCKARRQAAQTAGCLPRHKRRLQRWQPSAGCRQRPEVAAPAHSAQHGWTFREKAFVT